MSDSIKRKILLLINELEEEVGTDDINKVFIPEVDKHGNIKEDSLGCNQFRSIANDCNYAECYEEIRLLVKYTIAKQSGGKSWKTKCSNGKTFGEIILDYIAKVKDIKFNDAFETEEQQWRRELNNLKMFFGFMYWQARVWTDSNDSSDNNENNHAQNRPHNNNNNNNNNNNGTNKKRPQNNSNGSDKNKPKFK